MKPSLRGATKLSSQARTLLLLSEKTLDREVLAHLSGELGLKFRVSGDFETVLDEYERERPTAILLDTQMRDGNVMRTNSVLRGLGWDGPVIGIGSKREPFVSFGLNDVLETPLDINRCILKLSRWLGQKPVGMGLPIIDWEVALEAFHTDRAHYADILKSFASEFREFESQWDLEDEARSIAQIHNLAGAAGGLRLKRLHSLGQATEQLLAEQCSSALRSKLQELVLRALQELFEAIPE